MHLDHSLIMGMFLGVVVALWYGAQLTPYLPLFIIGAVVLLIRYITAK